VKIYSYYDPSVYFFVVIAINFRHDFLYEYKVEEFLMCICVFLCISTARVNMFICS